MTAKAAALFAGAVAAVAALALIETWTWPAKAALYPRAVGVPLLALAVAEAVLTLASRRDRSGSPAADLALFADVPPEVTARRARSVLAWMLGLYAAVAVVGAGAAVPLFVYAYLRRQAAASRFGSLAAALCAWAVFTLLFVTLLRVPFPPGWVWGR